MLNQTTLRILGRWKQNVGRILLALAGLVVVGVLVWQGITSAGNPDPTVAHISPEAAIINTGILVFREGLECILVLSAITASMMGTNRAYRKPIAAGAGGGFVAVVATWFAVIAILSRGQCTSAGGTSRNRAASGDRPGHYHELVLS